MTLMLAACPGDEPDPEPEPPQCVPFDADACMPQFPAQFDRVHDELLLPVCGVQGGACHGDAGAEGAIGGLVIDDDAQRTYDTLLGVGGGPSFVEAGDVDCSPILARVNTDADDPFLMPPGGTLLAEGRRCSLAQWVAAGAPR